MATADLKEKMAYLQGMVSGLGLDTTTREGQIMQQVLELLDSLVGAVTELQKAQEETEEYLESVDQDLFRLEDEVYGPEEREEDDEEPEHVEVECPECRETVCFDPELLEDEGEVEVNCPQCGTVVFTTQAGTWAQRVDAQESAPAPEGQA
ncbi:MAG: AraC family transcriptional regulator [Clostridia bacterium]|jgi:ribosomal protein S27E|nr:AraC family transcriptional regulator [Clostridia bacterium]MDH7572649.1 AraC family transcriptional regulator [Clostridia bacterium]